jgi:hypothetical protein
MACSRNFRSLAALTAGLAFALLTAEPSQAQTTATITGSITDTSGGALPGVHLTLEHVATGLVRTLVTGPDGRFVFAGIPVDGYSLRAELTGFRPLIRQGLELTVGQTLDRPARAGGRRD